MVNFSKFYSFGLMLLITLAYGCGQKSLDTPQPIQEDKMQESTVIMLPFSDPRLAIMGRTEKLADGGLRFSYPGVTAKFKVRALKASLRARSTSDQSYLEIIVDDGAPRVVKLSSSSQLIPLFSDTQKTLHNVEIIHRSETWHGLVTFEQLEISEGDLLAAPQLPERRILILGDSVTCGEAVERTAECKKDSSWWNPSLSYGMLTAKALNAQVNLVCYGGRGLIRSWNGKTDEQNLGDYFELTIADGQNSVTWDHSQYAPDLILSAIGTNDFSVDIPDREVYVSAYVKLIKRLLELHPQSQIVLTEGAILNGDKKAALSEYLLETQQRISNPRLHIVPSKHYPGDDCDPHPTKEQHANMAQDLTPLLREFMDW